MTLPRRNLPGAAENWGRAVESALAASRRELRQVQQVSDNALRFQSGQTFATSRQLNDLFERTTQVQNPANLSASGNNSSIVSATRTISFTSPARTVWADVEVYATWTRTGGGGDQNVLADILFQGSPICRMTSDSRDDSISGWGNNFKFYGRQTILIPEGVAADFTLRMFRVGFTATTTTETLSGIEAYLTQQSPAQ